MKNTITKFVPALFFAAAVGAVSAQSISTSSSANSYQVEVEDGGTVKAGRGPKRVLTIPRAPAPEVRAFAFAGGHPFAQDRASQTLIVQTGEYDPKAADTLREDMAVMSRILQKTCAEFASDKQRVMGLDILINGRSPNLFIEDYGAIFTLNVDIPLRAIGNAENRKDDEAESANAEWEDARNELFGTRRPHGDKAFGVHMREFRAEDVTRLRNDLIDALRNAANIRGLKDDHWVTVVVRSRSTGSPEGELYLSDAEAGGDDSIMVLKVRKSELGSSAKGERGDLKKRVSVQTY